MPITDVYCPICFKTEFINVKSLNNFDHRSLHGDRSTIFNFDTDEENFKHRKKDLISHAAHSHRFSMYEKDLTRSDAKVKNWIQQAKQHNFARIKVLNNFEAKPDRENESIPRMPVKAKRREVSPDEEEQVVSRKKDYPKLKYTPLSPESSADIWNYKSEEKKKYEPSLKSRVTPRPSPASPTKLDKINNEYQNVDFYSRSLDSFNRKSSRRSKTNENDKLVFKSPSFIDDIFVENSKNLLEVSDEEFRVLTPKTPTSRKSRKSNSNQQYKPPPSPHRSIASPFSIKNVFLDDKKSSRGREKSRDTSKRDNVEENDYISAPSPVPSTKKSHKKSSRRHEKKDDESKSIRSEKENARSPSISPIPKESQQTKHKAEKIKKKLKEEYRVKTPSSDSTEEKLPRIVNKKNPKKLTEVNEKVTKTKRVEANNNQNVPIQEKQKPEPIKLPVIMPKQSSTKHREQVSKSLDPSANTNETEKPMKTTKINKSTENVETLKTIKKKLKESRNIRNEKDVQTDTNDTFSSLNESREIDLTKRSSRNRNFTKMVTSATSPIIPALSDSLNRSIDSDLLKPYSPLRRKGLQSIALSPIIKRQNSFEKSLDGFHVSSQIMQSPIIKKIYYNHTATSPILQKSLDITRLSDRSVSPIQSFTSKSEKYIQTDKQVSFNLVDSFQDLESEEETDDDRESESRSEKSSKHHHKHHKRHRRKKSHKKNHHHHSHHHHHHHRRHSKSKSREATPEPEQKPEPKPEIIKKPEPVQIIETEIVYAIDQGTSPMPDKTKDDIVITLGKKDGTQIIEVGKKGDTRPGEKPTKPKQKPRNILVVNKNNDVINLPNKDETVLPAHAAFVYDDDARSDTSGSSRPVTSHSQKRPQIYPSTNPAESKPTKYENDSKGDDSIVFKLEDLPKDITYLEEKRYVHEAKAIHDVFVANSNEKDDALAELHKRPLSTIEENDTDETNESMENNGSNETGNKDETGKKDAVSKLKLKLKDHKTDLNNISEDEESEITMPSYRGNKHVAFDSDTDLKYNNDKRKKRNVLLPREKEISSREKAILFVEDNFSNRYIGKKPSNSRKEDFVIDDLRSETNDDLISNPTIRITSAKSIASRSDNLSVLSEPASRFNVRIKNRPNVVKTEQKKKAEESDQRNENEKVELSMQEVSEINNSLRLMQNILEPPDENKNQNQQMPLQIVYPSSAPPQMANQINTLNYPSNSLYYYPQSALPYMNQTTQSLQYYSPSTQTVFPIYEQPGAQLAHIPFETQALAVQPYYINQPLPEQHIEYVAALQPQAIQYLQPQTLALQRPQTQPQQQPVSYTPMLLTAPSPVSKTTETRNAAVSPMQKIEKTPEPKKPLGPALIITNNTNNAVLIRDSN